MSLYEVAILGGFPGLSMRITMDSFQMAGKWDNLNMELNMKVSKRIVFF